MKSLPWKRLAIGALVVLSVALVVWFAGPLFAVGQPRLLESAKRRWFVIGLAVLVWVLVEATRAFIDWRRNRRMIAELAASGEEESQSRMEAQQLEQRFSSALGVLKSAKFAGGGGARLLYQLPWYIFIGAPGSGKTTALVNCGLRFPLAESGTSATAVGGIGGTRNCDWWFTDRAVLIDTAGRYTTQDSNTAVDRRAWGTFLQLLKRYRPRQPINGIIVTLSVTDLVTSTPQERQRYAQTVRQRVDELQRDLGLQFPIYVVVTKCDLVAGFSEFFATFDADQRAQVWGISFDLDIRTREPVNAREAFDNEFPHLLLKLNELLLARLQEERDPDRRGAMYPFPQQLAAIGPLVSEFLASAFSVSSFNEPTLVRGVYFTSGTQQGAPIDRLIGSLSRSLALAQAGATIAAGTARGGLLAGSAKAFFLTRLMSEVIFPEAGLTGFSEEREKRLRRLNWALMGTCLLVSGALLAAWTISFLDNRQGLADAGKATAKAKAAVAQVGPPAPADLTVLVEALNSIRGIGPAVHDPVGDPPLRMGWGLYQGQTVDDQAKERYRTALQQGLLPRIALHLETIMAAPSMRPEAVYAALKAYLMMYEAKRMDPPYFIATVSELWNSAGVDREVASAARTHLIDLVATGNMQVNRFHPADEALIAAARGKVATASMVDRAYSLLRLSGAGTGAGLRLSEVLGPGGVGVLTRASGASLADPIDAVFTREGYLRLVRPKLGSLVKQLAEEEAWVLGPKASGVASGTNTRELERAVLLRFLADYKATWDGVLADIRLRKLDGIRDAMNAAQVLAQPDSPLKRLVAAVAEQVRLAPAEGKSAVAGAAEEAMKQRLKDAATTAATGIFGSGTRDVVNAAAATSDPLRAQELAFEEQFAPVRRLAGDGKAPAEIDAAIAIINEVFNELVAIQQRVASGQGIKEMPATLGRASAQAERFAPPVAGIIQGLVNHAQSEASGGVKKEVQAGVGGASSMCQRAIPGKYPFARGSQQDAGVQDFVNVFKAGGDLDSYFTANLAQYVDKSGGVWKLKGSRDAAPPVSPGTLRQFQNAEAIRNAFLNGGSTPGVTVDVSVTGGDAEVTLEYDGATHKLRVGTPGVRLAWPAKPGAKLSVNGQPVAAADGAWAIFRLVDKGSADPSATGDRVRTGFSGPGGARAQLELRTGSAAYNPFRLRELEAFGCPRE
ncbi:MAG: type VI secretion system membrane subunit TssM [Burkholderiales bacterium]|nr:type VI secretion system membrane subunit TssM [Burkholderiales bacterium]